MTNTDTADVAGDGAAGGGAGPRRQRAGAGDGQQRGRRRRPSLASSRSWTGSASRCRSSATSTTTVTCCSPAIPTAPGPWPSTGSIPGNVGGKRADENFRAIIEVALRQRQAGADRCQLGLARPEPADRDDGRERPSLPIPCDARDVTMEAMVESALRSAALAESAGTARTTGSSSARRCPACRTWWTSTACSRHAATTRSTLASPRPASAPRASSRAPRV